MKILIASDSFKECLTSYEVGLSIETGIRKACPTAKIEIVPIGDGGEGSLEALIHATKGSFITRKVHGPLNTMVEAKYGTIDTKTCIIEMSQASGLGLIDQKKRDPLLSSTFGTGELIKDALDKGYRNFIVAIGGSATNDCGIGALKALGASLLDEKDKEVHPSAKGLIHLRSINLSNFDKRIKESTFLVASDVNNPLLGKRGAVKVYGPQKGLKEEEICAIEKAFERFSFLVKEKLNKDISSIPSLGAAGGFAASLYAFFDAKIEMGFSVISEIINLEKTIIKSDLIITGEGEINYQTIHGKAPIGVAKLAKKHNKPVIGLSAQLSEGYESVYNEGIDAVFSIAPGPILKKDSIKLASKYLMQRAYDIMKVLTLGVKCET